MLSALLLPLARRERHPPVDSLRMSHHRWLTCCCRRRRRRRKEREGKKCIILKRRARRVRREGGKSVILQTIDPDDPLMRKRGRGVSSSILAMGRAGRREMLSSSGCSLLFLINPWSQQTLDSWLRAMVDKERSRESFEQEE